MCDSIRCVACVTVKSISTNYVIHSFILYQRCNLVKLTEPLHHLFDGSEVLLLFFLWICVIIPQETNSIVCLQKKVKLKICHCSRGDYMSHSVIKQDLFSLLLRNQS